MENGNGMELLAHHLAHFKLKAEEEMFALNQEIALLRLETKRKTEEIENYHQIFEHCENVIRQLKLENSKKWRVQERDDWKSLVHSIQEDRLRLNHENDLLKTQVRKDQTNDPVHDVGGVEEKLLHLQQTNQRLIEELGEERLAHHAFRIQATAEIDAGKKQLDHLRHKLALSSNTNDNGNVLTLLTRTTVSFKKFFNTDSTQGQCPVVQV